MHLSPVLDSFQGVARANGFNASCRSVRAHHLWNSQSKLLKFAEPVNVPCTCQEVQPPCQTCSIDCRHQNGLEAVPAKPWHVILVYRIAVLMTVSSSPDALKLTASLLTSVCHWPVKRSDLLHASEDHGVARTIWLAIIDMLIVAKTGLTIHTRAELLEFWQAREQGHEAGTAHPPLEGACCYRTICQSTRRHRCALVSA